MIRSIYLRLYTEISIYQNLKKISLYLLEIFYLQVFQEN